MLVVYMVSVGLPEHIVFKKGILFFLSTLINIVSVLFLSNSIAMAQTVQVEHFQRLQPAISGALYLPAETFVFQGEKELVSLPNYGLQIGFEFDFWPAKRWSIISGFMLFRQPVHHSRFEFSAEELGPQEEEELIARERGTFPTSFKIPLNLRYQSKIGENSYLDFRVGTFFQWLPEANYEFDFISGPPEGPSRKLFQLQAGSRERYGQVGFTLSNGIILIKENHLMKLLAGFHFFGRDIFEGEYAFVNIPQSSSGTYRMSGNHFSLTFVFSWIRNKYR